MQHTYRNRAFSITLAQQEDDQWHGYAIFGQGGETVQVAGLPATDKKEARRNALIAGRDHIRESAQQ